MPPCNQSETNTPTRRHLEAKMKISIFGMGYVGAVTAACLAKEGHMVTGVDVSKDKVEQIMAGKSPIVEEKIGEILAEET